MTDYRQAFVLLDQYIARELGACNAPGIALGLTDSEKTLYVGTYGHADLAARLPVQPQHLFEIGSISKAFSSIVALQLQARGLLDLHAPVTDYLPWFRVQNPYEPITLHHLMSHTAGLIMGTDECTAAAGEVWDLRHTQVSAPPGTFFHYSNAGYKLVGLVLQAVLGQSQAEILRQNVLAPLGMDSSEPAITHTARQRLAVGYTPFYDDRPLLPGGHLAPATWLESDTADGSICSTAGDMCKYLRFLLKRGQGLLSESDFELLVQRAIPTSDDEHGNFYGYGIETLDLDGAYCIGHDGGMVGYVSGLIADMDAGLGVVVLTNGPAELERIVFYALEVLRAAYKGEDLPPPPPAIDPYQVEEAADYCGVYQCGQKSFSIQAQGERLFLAWEGPVAGKNPALHGDPTAGKNPALLPVQQHKPGRLYVAHPDFERFLLSFGRQEGKVVEAFHGPDWYTREGYAGPTTFDFPPEWACYPGHYRSHNPWNPNFRVILRKGALILIDPAGDEEPMHPVSQGEFRVGEDTRSPERIRFEAIVDGKAIKANLSGGEYCRTFTP
ncbi:MAG: beta-lactamase family protein [Anaerolineales bacterium]|nr:beta-lactamase family protein [Anaerolineales bacterium]